MALLTKVQSWGKPLLVYFVACFTVLVLPFAFPPKLLLGVSVANQVGFNNKVASIGAACISLAVFLFTFRSPQSETEVARGTFGPLSRRLVLSVCAASILFYTVLALLVLRSNARYISDAGYFVEQIRSFSDYGRRPYQQIEFPYGPALFYLPVFFYRLLSPFHVTLMAVFFVALVLEHVIGIACLAYIINRLAIRETAKKLIFIACAYGAIQMNLGPNYSYFRFALPPAILLYALRRRGPWPTAAALFAGQFVSLCISSELGFAYAAGGLVYGSYMTYTKGREWVLSALAPLVGAILFLAVIGRAYILMLELFAAGIFNLPIEPLPHILLFLIPLVLINPYGLAVFMRARHPEAPVLAALSVFSMALLPVAFGRADPGHVADDGLMVMLLSLVFVSVLSIRIQKAWTIAAMIFFVYTTSVNIRTYKDQMQDVLPQGITGYPFGGTKNAALVLLRTGSWSKAKTRFHHTYTYPILNIPALQQIVASGPVTTPYPLPRGEEEKLRRAGLFAPTFYCFTMGVLDSSAEDRQINELNQRRWILFQDDFTKRLMSTELPTNTEGAMGFQITYPSKHPPYIMGVRFKQNLDANWQFRTRIGEYLLFERRK